MLCKVYERRYKQIGVSVLVTQSSIKSFLKYLINLKEIVNITVSCMINAKLDLLKIISFR